MKTIYTFTSSLLIAGACSTVPPAVPVSAVGASMIALHGEWVGDFQYSDTDVNGAIHFVLDARGDSAVGDVLRFGPQRSNQVVDRMQPHGRVMHTGRNQNVRIPFIRAAGGQLYGELEPYWDADCECEARADFSGDIADEVISGSFSSYRNGPPQRGKWKVERQAGSR